jgi:hypothetical protein
VDWKLESARRGVITYSQELLCLQLTVLQGSEITNISVINQFTNFSLLAAKQQTRGLQFAITDKRYPRRIVAAAGRKV